MSHPQPPTKTQEQLHYESMISYLKWAIGIAGGLIAVIAAVAVFVTFSDRNAMREEYTNAIKELKTQIADIKNDAKDKTQSIRDDAKDAVRATQEQAGKEISGITLSTHDAAIRETEKQISQVFETNKIQELIETKAIAEIQQKLTPLLEKQTKSITSNTNLPLFVRKPSGLRGTTTLHESGRQLLVTDNTPAHWVYKKIVMDNELLTLNVVRDALTSYILPLAMMRKTKEVDLRVTQVASKEHRLGNENWKLAHINRIALPRVKDKTIQHHVTHHRMFLSLGNMYLISKEYAGLAEVPLFNEIVVKNKTAL